MTHPLTTCVTLGSFVLAAWSPAATAAGDEPRWEAGIAAGAGRIADYPGSDQAHVRGLAVPVVIYRGPVLRIDREGIRSRLLDNPDLELDLAATASFNTRNNDARQGMPRLDYLLGAGPRLTYKGLRSMPGQPELRLAANAIVSSNLRRVDDRGLTLEPEVRWRHGEWSAGVQPTWASRRLMRYFYEVDPAYATADRPAYSARAGYMGTTFKLDLHHRVDASLSWFVAVRALSLQGAANEASPLLRSRTNLSIGAGLVWTPWRSTSTAASED
jgi:outer membrane scaffolding protein for murein synthesis (MipA/OmpV family)